MNVIPKLTDDAPNVDTTDTPSESASEASTRTTTQQSTTICLIYFKFAFFTLIEIKCLLNLRWSFICCG